ncbi:MAG: mechanosensitive ion channel family protein, partial [Ignavibacteriaceae bacterium]|nr:mechanosensitive ion channel family protein [Ignavibacteriaceae bacterium]
MQEIFNYSIFGNSVYNYLIALGIFISGIVIVFIFKKFILSRLKRWAESTSTSIDDLLVRAIKKSLIPVFYFGVFYMSLHTLILSPDFKKGLSIAAIILITILIVRTIISAINHGLRTYLKKSDDSDEREKQIKGIRGIVNLAIWAIALVFLLDNLGLKISAVVAALGIGGIAIALAAQAVLGDLFSYFVIFFDKPFKIGDFIIVGDKVGVVEYTGIKTTRIRALSGEQIVFSNTDLTNSRVHNYKKMERRRVVFKLGVIYQTPSRKLKMIPQIVKEIIERQDDTVFDRGHFASYGDFSLNF